MSWFLAIYLDLGAGALAPWPRGPVVELEGVFGDGPALLVRPGAGWWRGAGLVACRAAWSEPNGGLLVCEGRPSARFATLEELPELLDGVDAAAVLLW